MKISRVVYTIAAWSFVAGVVVQVFFAGMAVVAGRWPWTDHINLGHFLAMPLLVMLVTMYVGKMGGSLKRLTWLLFLAYVLQADLLIFLRGSAPALSALHPVLALVDFALGVLLAWRATAMLRDNEPLMLRQLQSDGMVSN